MAHGIGRQKQDRIGRHRREDDGTERDSRALLALELRFTQRCAPRRVPSEIQPSLRHDCAGSNRPARSEARRGNGIRQPQESICLTVKVPANTAPNAVARTVVRPWLANCQLAKKPRLSGCCSARKAVAAPNSPPAENPWMLRANTTRSAPTARWPHMSARAL